MSSTTSSNHVGFGKYKNQSWSWVMRNDDQYLIWCMNSLDPARFKPLPEAVLKEFLMRFPTNAALDAYEDYHSRFGKVYDLNRKSREPEMLPEYIQEQESFAGSISDRIADFERTCMDIYGCFPPTRGAYYAKN